MGSAHSKALPTDRRSFKARIQYRKGNQYDKQRPVAFWFLVVSLVFLGFGGLYGGIAMLADPSGNFK